MLQRLPIGEVEAGPVGLQPGAILLVTQQVPQIALPALGRQRPPPGAQIGDVDQTERPVGREHDIAQMKGTEIDPGIVQAGDKGTEALMQFVRRLASPDQLAQCLPGKRQVPDGIPRDARNAIHFADLRTGDPSSGQCDRIVGKTPSVWVPSRCRNQAFAAKKLEIAAIRQLQYLFSMTVLLEHDGIGTQRKVIVMSQISQCWIGAGWV